LFCGLGESLNVPLQSQTRERLRCVFREVIEGKKMEEDLEVLQTIASVLLDKEKQEMIRDATIYPIQNLFK